MDTGKTDWDRTAIIHALAEGEFLHMRDVEDGLVLHGQAVRNSVRMQPPVERMRATPLSNDSCYMAGAGESGVGSGGGSVIGPCVLITPSPTPPRGTHARVCLSVPSRLLCTPLYFGVRFCGSPRQDHHSK